MTDIFETAAETIGGFVGQAGDDFGAGLDYEKCEEFLRANFVPRNPMLLHKAAIPAGLIDGTPFAERIAEIRQRVDDIADELHYVSNGDVEWLLDQVAQNAKRGQPEG